MPGSGRAGDPRHLSEGDTLHTTTRCEGTVAGRGCHDRYIFTSNDGLPLRRTNFRRRHWLPAVGNSVGEPCRFHDLRHTHFALLIAQGEHPKTIAARLGHTSVRTVLDVYGHR